MNFVATCILGNPAFAFASLAMMAINAGADGKMIRVVNKVMAISASIGYGIQVFGAQESMAFFAQISTVVMGIKLYVWDNEVRSARGRSQTTHHHHYYYPPTTRTIPPSSPPVYQQKGFATPVTRNGVWG